MTTPTRIERELPGILGDLSAGPAPDYLDDVFGRTGRTRQRPAWSFPERWLPMADITRSRAFPYSPPWRLIAVALVIIALIVAAALAYVGSQQHACRRRSGRLANGLIPYASNGDIYLGDPITGQTRLLVAESRDDIGCGHVARRDSDRVRARRPGTTLHRRVRRAASTDPTCTRITTRTARQSALGRMDAGRRSTGPDPRRRWASRRLRDHHLPHRHARPGRRGRQRRRQDDRDGRRDDLRPVPAARRSGAALPRARRTASGACSRWIATARTSGRSSRRRRRRHGPDVRQRRPTRPMAAGSSSTRPPTMRASAIPDAASCSS